MASGIWKYLDKNKQYKSNSGSYSESGSQNYSAATSNTTGNNTGIWKYLNEDRTFKSGNNNAYVTNQYTSKYTQPQHRTIDYSQSGSDNLRQAAAQKVAYDNSYVTGSATGDRVYQNYLRQLENQYKNSVYRANKNDPKVLEQEKQIKDIQNKLIQAGRAGDVAGTYMLNQDLNTSKNDLRRRRLELSSALPDFSATDYHGPLTAKQIN